MRNSDPRRRWVAAVVMAVALASGATPAVAAIPGGVPPITGAPVVRDFDPPAAQWDAGHRGVDLGAPLGAIVRAPSAGLVTFARFLAGRPVLVIDHGGVRTTLEPVRATVAVGTRVARGDPVGVVVAGGHCASRVCLHWGLRRGDEYLNPLSMLRVDVRLLSDAAAADIRAAAELAASTPGGTAGAEGPGASGRGGVLSAPVPGRVTSPFGRRFHPIFHVWRLHAGVDFAASCGSLIRAAADGVVRHAAYDDSGGWRLIIDHGVVGGTRLQTSYLHAQGYRVRVGQRVRAGAVVGSVGSTGWSTGCHLHFGVKANGSVVNPQGWL